MIIDGVLYTKSYHIKNKRSVSLKKERVKYIIKMPTMIKLWEGAQKRDEQIKSVKF